MKRREFISLLGGAAAALPLAARAQQSERMRRIGVLLRVAQDDPDAQLDLQALRKGLRAVGWVAGHNIEVNYRYASADLDQMRAYAAELVGLPAEVIVAAGDKHPSNRVRAGRRSGRPGLCREPRTSR